MAEVKVRFGEVIMRHGDKGNNYYMIKEGTCDVVVPPSTVGESQVSRTITAGGSCGELALLTGQNRSATITASSSEVTLLMANRKTFNSVIGDLVNTKRAAWCPFVSRVSIFEKDLSLYEMGLVADAIKPTTFEDGTVITQAGEASRNRVFYLVREGKIEDTTQRRTLEQGDYFGEVEILQQSNCQATRVARGSVVCGVLTPENFMKLVPLHALIKDSRQQQYALQQQPAATAGARPMRGRRYGESAEATTVANTKTKIPTGSVKSAEAMRRIEGAIRQNKIFSRLNDHQLQLLQQAMMEHHVEAGSNVITQGEKGNHYYIVDQGELDAYVKNASASQGEAPTHVKSFGPGDSFGELALMYNCPRTATIQARTDTVLWSLDRVSFRSIVLEANTKKASMYESFLEKVQLLEPLTKDQRNRMVDALEEVTYAPGQAIIKEGEEGTHFYIIVEGDVSITKEGQAAELARRSASDYFGELSLKTGAPTIASVSAVALCKLIRMDRGAFLRLLGPLDSLLALRKYTANGVELAAEDESNEGGGGDLKTQEIDFSFSKCSGPLQLSDFSVTKGTLGEGAFGKVRRCLHKKTGQVFALKQMCKSDIVSMGQVEHIMQETQILSRIMHPFVTNKFGAVVTLSNLILIMEFCPGGDLFDQLYKHKSFGLADARIFTLQVLLPLEYLHGLGIVHRDLKLENILVAQTGELKLTDFGFAKYIKYRSWTLCGTPEYLAPEIILEKGHGKAVDYWAFGVLFYEMLNGHSPFEAEDHLATYQKILDGSVNYPSTMHCDATDLISKLLQKDISRRYGNLVNGAQDIKDHVFYINSGISWDPKKVFTYRGSIKPDKFESSKYDWLSAEAIVTDAKKCADKDQSLFHGF